MKELSKRATVYFDPRLFRALQLKAVDTESSVSALIAVAIKNYLSEDAEDLAAFDERAGERGVSFEQVIKKLKRNGKL